ncbi:uncharacterized protein LOC115879181 [Sitophilus oryzae]|uniref:Uncharacterized protein LOC115879181 n=1 Tax=Sitophilus oryzae TaxID=7048 RepID=A0A6J2XJQ5_SITOR|nr:uncharacterized protein LOC115879181 [Sitophilus oryzae]
MFVSAYVFGILITLFLLLMSYFWNKRRMYRLSLKLPGPISLPVIGNGLQLLCSPEDMYDHSLGIFRRYPSPMSFWFGPKFSIIFKDATQVEKIFTSTNLSYKDDVYKFIEVFEGQSLIAGSGPKWKKDRKLLSFLFTKKNIMKCFDDVVKHSKTLTNFLEHKVDKAAFNVEHYIHRAVTDFINESYLGIKINSQAGELDDFLDKVQRIYKLIYKRIVKPWLQVEFFYKLTPIYKEQEICKEVIHGFFYKVLNDAKEDYEKSQSKEDENKTILEQIIEIRKNVPDFATDEEMVHHMLTLYAASEDTISQVSSYVLVMLGMYPHYQERVVKEIDAVLGKEDIREDDISRLEFMEMVIKEVMRLFPIAPFIMRKAVADTEVEGYTIPKGASVMIAISLMHRDPVHWEKPDEFYPEHFYPEAVQKRHPYAYVPFSAGSRQCIGKIYAYMAMKIVLATFLQKFSVEADGTLQDKALTADISVRFKDGVYPVRIKRRTMMLLTYFISFIITIVLGLSAYFWSKRKMYRLSLKLPGPVSLPVIGNGLEFWCKDEDIFERAVSCIRKYPSPLSFWFGPKFSIVFKDATQVEKIFMSSNFSYKDDIYNFMKEFDGEALITGSGTKWKRDRKLMSFMFNKKNTMKYFDNVFKHCKLLMQILEKEVDQPSFNVQQYINRAATDFVNESFLGVKFHAQTGELDDFLDKIARTYALVHRRMVKPWLQVEFLYKLTPTYKEQELCKEVIHGFFYKALNQAKQNYAQSKDKDELSKTMLEQILEIRNDVPDFATDEEIVHHLATLYSASEDTITQISSYVLVLLGMYPHYQKKVVEEIDSIIGKEDVRDCDLVKFEYLDMVIKEALRLFPIGPFILRKSHEDAEIGEYFIPKGTTVMVAIHLIHRDPVQWEKPEEFYPEHFMPESVKKRHPYAFVPFSAGARQCLGKIYAYMAMKVIIVTFLQRFAVEADGSLRDKELTADISVRFKDETYPIRIRKRH